MAPILGVCEFSCSIHFITGFASLSDMFEVMVPSGNLPVRVSGLLWLATAAFLFWTSRKLLRKARNATGARAHDKRRPVVLLRSFQDDGQEVRDVNPDDENAMVRVEDALAKEIRLYGPFIAIGEPGQGQSGASRDFHQGEDWRDAVKGWMDEAVMIVAIPGWTEGLRWEILTAISRGHARKLILAMPPNDPHQDARWSTVRICLFDTPWRAAAEIADVRDALIVHLMDGGRLAVLKTTNPVLKTNDRRRQALETALHVAVYGLILDKRIAHKIDRGWRQTILQALHRRSE
jgi:membrane protein implicated in regulation of membrane protease activity